MATKAESTKKAEAKKEAPAGFEAFADFFKAPTVDVTTFFDFQRKNFETAVEANRIAFEGVKKVAQKQVDVAKEVMADLNEAATETFNTKTPENGFQRTVDLVQTFSQKNVKSVREIADLAVEENQKVVALVQERYTAGVAELQATAK